MARLMLSAVMFSALAAATAPRRRGFFSGSPPDLAAMVISLIRRVKIFPRLASSAPFLCLIVAHLEWPDMAQPLFSQFEIYFTARQKPLAGIDLMTNENYSMCNHHYSTKPAPEGSSTQSIMRAVLVISSPATSRNSFFAPSIRCCRYG